MTVDETDIHARLLQTHRGTVDTVIDAGRAVVSSWSTDRVSDPDSITDPLETLLESTGVTADLVRLLHDGAETANTSVQGNPVPAPPYLIITSRGPLCRGTLADGSRLVVRLELFSVERDPVEYVFTDPDPGDCLRIHHKR